MGGIGEERGGYRELYAIFYTQICYRRCPPWHLNFSDDVENQ
jgi:hypothetical protein